MPPSDKLDQMNSFVALVDFLCKRYKYFYFISRQQAQSMNQSRFQYIPLVISHGTPLTPDFES